MINIEFWPDHIKITGHAGYAPKGQDIVCAAVSILYVTFSTCLESLDIECGPEETQSETGTELRWQKPLGTAGIVLLTALRTGLFALANAYPENVTIHDFKPL